MKIVELLQEETLQAIIKRLLKPAKTSIFDLMGTDYRTAAKLLSAKSDEEPLIIRGDSPAASRVIKSLSTSPAFSKGDAHQHGTLKTVRLPGGALVLVVGSGDDAFVLTTTKQKNQLVESADN